MKNMMIAAAVAAALSVPVGALAAAAPSSEELAQIREQLQGLIQRVDRLEQENTTLKGENEKLKAEGEYLQAETRGLRKDAAQTATTVNAVKGSEWAARFTLSGDLRYRYEYIADDTVAPPATVPTADRFRDRIRARFNAVGRPTDTIQVGLGFATTEGGDPRSTNQSLTNVFSRKSLDLDLAYFDWTFSGWGHFIGGKMRQPFVKSGQSLFWDNDVNPEGLALTFSRGIWFGSAYNFWLQEVSGLESTTTSDPMMHGAQIGARLPIGSSTLTLAAHYYDLSASERRAPAAAPIFGGNANGNTTCTVGLCGVAAATLAFDYEVAELMAQFNTTLGGLPLQVWAVGVQNQAVDNLDTGWAAGFLWGAAGNYRTWELGVNYHSVGKDSVYAQVFDSDFGGGVTDTQGYVFRAGYAPLRNWVLNATYFLNDRNVDVPNAAGMTEVGYDRLQLDFNLRF